MQNISIEEIGGKEYKLTFFDPLTDKAILTHYLHNYNNGVSKFYIKDATEILERFVKYKTQQNQTLKVEEVLQKLLFEVENVPFPTPKNYTFKFIDLFAGVGGFRIAMQNNGGKCVFTSEWDKNAQITYKENYGEVPFGDISLKNTKRYITDKFDVLCAGFPCQPFSIAADGHNGSLIKDKYGIRKLTPRETFAFQGYPEKFVLPNISRGRLYMQAS